MGDALRQKVSARHHSLDVSAGLLRRYRAVFKDEQAKLVDQHWFRESVRQSSLEKSPFAKCSARGEPVGADLNGSKNITCQLLDNGARTERTPTKTALRKIL